MSTSSETFIGSVSCMDGRDAAAVAVYAAGRFVDDLCSGPGTVGILADPEHDEHEVYVDKLKRQMVVSYTKHGMREATVSGHAECAGHPVADEQHQADILAAAAVVRHVALELGFTDMKVVPLWNARNVDGDWVPTKLEIPESVAAE